MIQFRKYNITMTKKMGQRDTCVIIPCAGKGARLGLATSKEVYQIEPSKRLIDYSLAHVKKSKHVDRIAFVINPSKHDLINHLYEIKDSLPPFSLIFQKKNYFDWPGGVWSAEDLFCEKNIVLLPDSVLSYKGNLIDDMREKMWGRNHLVFAYKKEDDAKRIGSLGALFVEKTGLITRYREKPKNHLQQYNAFWCSFGFKKTIAQELFRVMTALAKGGAANSEVFLKKHRAHGLEIKSYHDLGTWENLQKYLLLGGIK